MIIDRGEAGAGSEMKRKRTKIKARIEKRQQTITVAINKTMISRVISIKIIGEVMNTNISAILNQTLQMDVFEDCLCTYISYFNNEVLTSGRSLSNSETHWHLFISLITHIPVTAQCHQSNHSHRENTVVP